MSNEHSELFRVMAEADGPGDVEYENGERWESTESWPVLVSWLFDDCRPWRIKPRTIELSARGRSFALPEPMREAPEDGDPIYADEHGGAGIHEWRKDREFITALGVGAIHRRYADAQAWAGFNRFARTGEGSELLDSMEVQCG